MEEFLPPLQSQYGEQLQVVFPDTSTSDGHELYVAADTSPTPLEVDAEIEDICSTYVGGLRATEQRNEEGNHIRRDLASGVVREARGTVLSAHATPSEEQPNRQFCPRSCILDSGVRPEQRSVFFEIQPWCRIGPWLKSSAPLTACGTNTRQFEFPESTPNLNGANENRAHRRRTPVDRDHLATGTHPAPPGGIATELVMCHGQRGRNELGIRYEVNRATRSLAPATIPSPHRPPHLQVRLHPAERDARRPNLS